MMKPSTTKGSALDGLPKQFVTAMRTLFDLMDDKRTGYVKFSDLEAFWSEEGLYGLPKGVLDSLRKVTPSNGLLSFERFCGGLKISLLRLQVEQNKQPDALDLERNPRSQPLPVSALDLADPPPVIRPRMPTNTATVRPTSSFPQQQQRTSSLPQLDDINVKEIEEPPPLRARKPQSQLKERRAGVQSVYGDFAPIDMGQPPQPPTYQPPPPPQLLGPPKPPRTNSGNLITNGALMMKAQKQSQDPKAPDGKNEGEPVAAKADVRTALQQWQMAQMTGYMEKSKSATVVGGLQSKDDHANIDVGKKNSKRREPRRHTLQNGIDYNMLKRMQAMEQEKEVLGTGLQAVEKTREWFHKQLTALHEQMRSMGKGHTDASLEAHLERLQFKIARIQDVSRQLNFLVENSDRGFPLHMNLAMRQPRLGYGHIERENVTSKQGDEEIGRIIRRLKEQNHQLTEEVGRKANRITELENEKAALIRELFQAKTQPRSTKTDDNTFM